MTYQEIRTALKSFQALDYEIPALNSKKAVLEAALAELQIIHEIAEASITEVLATPAVTATPDHVVTVNKKVLDHTTTNQYPAFLTALATVLAFIQLIWTKTAPHLKRGIAYSRIRVIPKLALASQFVGLVAVLIVLKAVRRGAIA